MLYGKDLQGGRISPKPKEQGFCPMCDTELIAKCGKIVTWHWAHKANECDPFHEPETEWHRKWKSEFPRHQAEVVIEKDGIRHQADVLTTNGTVIEFQHSSISVEEIQKREIFYRSMIWVFDVIKPFNEDRIKVNSKFTSRGEYGTFYWSHARKSIWQTQKPVFLDLGDGNLINVSRLCEGKPGGEPKYDNVQKRWYSPGAESWWGQGYLITKVEFLKRVLQ